MRSKWNSRCNKLYVYADMYRCIYVYVYIRIYMCIYAHVYCTHVYFVFTCGHLVGAFGGSGYVHVYLYIRMYVSFVLQIYFAMWDMRLVGAGGGGSSYWQYENVTFGITTAFGLPFRNCTGMHTHTIYTQILVLRLIPVMCGYVTICTHLKQTYVCMNVCIYIFETVFPKIHHYRLCVFFACVCRRVFMWLYV